MTGVIVEIPSAKWEKQRRLALGVGLREAVASYLRRRWPQHTAKNAARAFNWTHDRAREAVAGRVSLTSMEAMFQAGGFGVALPILAEVIGHGVLHFLQEQRKSHEEQAARLAAVAGGHLHLAADRADRDPGADRPLDRGRRAVGDRAARHLGE